jgi:hypothetical protein
LRKFYVYIIVIMIFFGEFAAAATSQSMLHHMGLHLLTLWR